MSDNDKAPVCPVSFDQQPKNPRGTAATRLPSIPLATDLPSLIRAVNIMRDLLRTVTTSLTVNNTYLRNATPSKKYGTKSYRMSDYLADWYQVGIDNKEGSVYYKTKKGMDKSMRADVERMDAVRFRNNARDNDQAFEWRYPKKLDGDEPGGRPFQEDFFERIINVHWGNKLDLTFTFHISMGTQGRPIPAGGCGGPGSEEGPFFFPADSPQGNHHYWPLEWVEWDLSQKPSGFHVNWTPDGGGLNGPISKKTAPPVIKGTPKIVGFPSVKKMVTIPLWTYTTNGLGGAFPIGQIAIARGPRAAVKIGGQNPPDQKLIAAKKIDLCAHGDSYTGDVSCRGPTTSVYNYLGATHSGIVLDARDPQLWERPVNYGEEYAQHSIDLSKTYVLADIGKGVERWDVAGISYSSGQNGQGGFWVPPVDGVSNWQNNHGWYDKTSWKNEYYGNPSPPPYRPGYLAFAVKCRRKGKS